VAGSRQLSIAAAVSCLREGAVIAYPTEAVFGLGCDPKNETAVREILNLKERPAEAGLILIADSFDRFLPFTQTVSPQQRELALSTWPGPVTWLFPRSEQVPDWLAGSHETIALRVTAHPVCRTLCAAFGGAIVSTSANTRQAEPARSTQDVERYFGSALCGIVAGDLGSENKPSQIRDLATGRILRQG
jgi:L-threonylcarbamoyladenylate synthase